MSLDRLRERVDLPALSRMLSQEAAGSADPGELLQWYDEADASTGREVATGRATAGDAAALQQEVFDLMKQVPGLQFVTNKPFGLPEDPVDAPAGRPGDGPRYDGASLRP